MEMSNIMVFSGLAIEKNKLTDAIGVQRYILGHEDSGCVVSIEDIQEALSLLEYAGFIRQVNIKNEGIFWKKA